MAATSAPPARRSAATSISSYSPSRRFNGYTSPGSSSTSSAFASYSSGFATAASSFFRRSVSVTPVDVCAQSGKNPSVRFSFDRSVSPNRSISAVGVKSPHQVVKKQSGPKRTCLCSPTTHPGSFRCSLHKNSGNSSQGGIVSPANRLNARRSAMMNSLVRIGGVEGDLVKRALSALIRPSSHQQRRRTGFQPRPSRLSVMSKAEDS